MEELSPEVCLSLVVGAFNAHDTDTLRKRDLIEHVGALGYSPEDVINVLLAAKILRTEVQESVMFFVLVL